MSKINLSKAKLGDKFRTRNGEVLTYKGTDDYIAKTRKNYHICARPDDYELTYFNNGTFIFYEEHPYDLVEQVFDDEKDTTDLEIVEAMNKAIKEIPEKIAEREQELQRRQEVVELAEKLFTEKYLQEWYQYLVNNKTTKTDYVTYIFEWAEKFVNAKDKYLKEGKL